MARVLSEWVNCLDSVVGKDQYNFFFFNDGSTDGTAAVLTSLVQQFNCLQLVNKTNTGHGPTCIFGYQHIIAQKKYDWIFQIDSDGQCDPTFFANFWQQREQHPWQWGQRVTRDDGWQRVVVSKILSLVVYFGSGVWVRDSNVPYRLMPLQPLQPILPLIPRDFFLANVLLSVLVQSKFGIHWHRIHFRDRFSGESKVKGWRFAKIGMKLYLDLKHMKENFK